MRYSKQKTIIPSVFSTFILFVIFGLMFLIGCASGNKQMKTDIDLLNGQRLSRIKAYDWSRTTPEQVKSDFSGSCSEGRLCILSEDRISGGNMDSGSWSLYYVIGKYNGKEEYFQYSPLFGKDFLDVHVIHFYMENDSTKTNKMTIKNIEEIPDGVYWQGPDR